MNQTDIFVDNLKEFRKRDLGLKQEEFGSIIGYSRPWMHKMEGHKSIPTINILYALHNHFALMPSWLLLGKGDKFDAGIIDVADAIEYAENNLNGQDVPEFHYLPVKDDKMHPLFKIGDRLTAMKNEMNHLELRYPYVIRKKWRTESIGRITKVTKESITLEFDNSNYPPEIIPMVNITGIYRVTESRTTQFPIL